MGKESRRTSLELSLPKDAQPVDIRFLVYTLEKKAQTSDIHFFPLREVEMQSDRDRLAILVRGNNQSLFQPATTEIPIDEASSIRIARTSDTLEFPDAKKVETFTLNRSMGKWASMYMKTDYELPRRNDSWFDDLRYTRKHGQEELVFTTVSRKKCTDLRIQIATAIPIFV